MYPRLATSAALGTILALAVTLTGAVAPALAATPAAIDHAVSLNAGGRPRPNVPPAPMFRPDLRVHYLGQFSDDRNTFFRFRVENIGAASADNIYVDQEVDQRTWDGSIGTLQSIGSHKIETLGTDESVEVRVPCTPLPGYVCVGASANASVAYELDPSNNKAHS